MLRADLFHGTDAAIETVVTAKEVLLSRDQAASEVRRLNALHPDGHVRYWYTSSRLFEDDPAGEDRVDPPKKPQQPTSAAAAPPGSRSKRSGARDASGTRVPTPG